MVEARVGELLGDLQVPLDVGPARELPPDLVDALHDARMFRMLLPRSLGGDEVSPVAFMQAIEELAKADASTAWCIAQTSVCSTISPKGLSNARVSLRMVIRWSSLSAVWPFSARSSSASP